MLIDMHAHTSGISRCCKADAYTGLLAAKEKGIDGLVLCNHYQEAYVENGDAAAFAKAYADEFIKTKAIADELGMRLFFGVEVTAKQHNNAHVLLYGLQPDFVLRHPEIYGETLERMQQLAHAEGGLVVQAHPFRSNGKLLDVNHLDGVEVNCHPLYDATHCVRLLQIAHENNLLVTCGGDYHADTYRPSCGTYFPDDVQDEQGLVNWLKETSTITLHVQELRTEEHADVAFVKGE